MWARPLDSAIQGLLDAIYHRTGAFELVPYSPFDRFLSTMSGQLGWEVGALRRLCFECATSLVDDLPLDEKLGRTKVYLDCFAAANQAFLPVAWSKPEYRLKPSDAKATLSLLKKRGVTPGEVPYEVSRSQLLLYPTYTTPNFVLKVVAGCMLRECSRPQVRMSIHTRSGEWKGEINVGNLFLNIARLWVRSPSDLTSQLEQDFRYCSAIVAHFGGAMSA